MDEKIINLHMEALLNHINKNCLWQFHSRAWDRRNQNAGILTKTRQILCGEKVELETPADKCYWVDAAILAEDYQQLFPWIHNLSNDEITAVMDALHKRLDFLMIDGSLNKELTDQHY